MDNEELMIFPTFQIMDEDSYKQERSTKWEASKEDESSEKDVVQEKRLRRG